MPNPTRVRERSNETSDEIEAVSPHIETVIPRDTSVATERYIIFTENGGLPTPPLDEIRALGFSIRHMDEHAIDYEHKDTLQRATYIAFPE